MQINKNKTNSHQHFFIHWSDVSKIVILNNSLLTDLYFEKKKTCYI